MEWFDAGNSSGSRFAAQSSMFHRSAQEKKGQIGLLNLRSSWFDLNRAAHV
jgi:hypothetical protein